MLLFSVIFNFSHQCVEQIDSEDPVTCIIQLEDVQQLLMQLTQVLVHPKALETLYVTTEHVNYLLLVIQFVIQQNIFFTFYIYFVS